MPTDETSSGFTRGCPLRFGNSRPLGGDEVISICLAVCLVLTPRHTEASEGYGYTLVYPLRFGSSRRLSGDEVFSIVRANFAAVFPLTGMVNNPQVGQRLNLQGANPVRIEGVTSRSLTIRSLEGHLEGPDNLITFSIDAAGATLTVHATGPKAAPLPQSAIPYAIWPILAVNIANLIDPGQNPYSGSWR